MKVYRVATGTIPLCIEGTQHEMAELCEALETKRKTKPMKDMIIDLAKQIRIASDLGDAPAEE